MTPKEAIDYMENEIRCIQRARYCDRDCVKCELVKEDKPLIEAFGKSINALEKQTPQKPHPQHTPSSVRKGTCPRCLMVEDESANYCRSCGQALDWSDDNDR